MLYKLINNPYELQTEFKKYNRDYYTITEYQAILDYFDEHNLIELDVISFVAILLKCLGKSYTKNGKTIPMKILLMLFLILLTY